MIRHGGWISRIVGALFGLVLLVLLAGFTYEQIGRTHDASRLPQRIGRAIDIVGRTLNLYCSGEGSPTVIFETGGNGPGYEWASIQTKLANFTPHAGTIAQAWDGVIRRRGREPAQPSSAISTKR